MAIDRVAKTWSRIADVTGASIELVHHARKTNGAEVTIDASRGAVALIAAARSARVLNRMTAEEGKQAGVSQHRRYFRTDDGKANLAAPADNAKWFRMTSVELGNSTPAYPDGDSIGVVTPWQWPDAMEGVTTETLRSVQKILDQGRCRRADVRSDQWVGRAVAEVMGLDIEVEADKAKVTRVVRVWTKNGGLIEDSDAKDEKGRKIKAIKPGNRA